MRKATISLAALTGFFLASSGARADFVYASIAGNTGNSAIVRIDTATGVQTTVATRLSSPEGLTFDGLGNLYVANSGDNTIESFTPGGVGTVFASTGLNAPVGLTFDGSGNLYAGNPGDNTIERFTPGGVGSVFASLGSSQPEFLAFQASPSVVPEPSSLVLCGLGLAATVGYTRRRLARRRGRDARASRRPAARL